MTTLGLIGSGLIGSGIEQNTHKIGECVDLRELQHSIAFLARFPSVFAGR